MIVLDSSFLIAFHNLRDVHHPEASRIMPSILDGTWGPALLPEYVFLEVVTVLASRRDVAAAVTVGDVLLQSEEIEFVPCGEVFPETLSVFRHQERTRLSFADSAIVAIARQRGARYVATFDTDFRDIQGLSVVP